MEPGQKHRRGRRGWAPGPRRAEGDGREDVVPGQGRGWAGGYSGARARPVQRPRPWGQRPLGERGGLPGDRTALRGEGGGWVGTARESPSRGSCVPCEPLGNHASGLKPGRDPLPALIESSSAVSGEGQSLAARFQSSERGRRVPRRGKRPASRSFRGGRELRPLGVTREGCFEAAH